MNKEDTDKLLNVGYVNPVSVTRGDNLVVFSNVLLYANEDQECRVKFPEEYGFGDFVFVFKNTEPPMKNPTMRIHPTSERTKIELLGWNAPIAYAANDPINIGSNDSFCLNISISTTYIGETYKADIQFYLEDKKAYFDRHKG